MKEKEIHELIESQNPEAKRIMWEKVSSQLDLGSIPPKKTVNKKKKVKLAVIAVAILCAVTLSIVLPLALRDNSPSVRFCTAKQYVTENLNQTLREYVIGHNGNFMYVDWYNSADEIKTSYAYNKDDKNDIIFFTEYLVHSETGEGLYLSVTDNRTRVDVFEEYYSDCTTVTIENISVSYRNWRKSTRAVFEYKNHIYYLQIDVGDAQERLTEIIEGMLK